MNYKGISWIVVALLAVAIFFVAKNKHIGNILQPNSPQVQRPFADDWSIPGLPPNGQQVPPANPPVNAPRTYADTLTLARQNNKPILLFFSASSCAPCQQMKRELTPSLPSLVGQLYWLEVDTATNADLCRKYNVTATPTYVIINTQEQVIKTGAGYRSVQAFGEWLAAPYIQPPQVQPTPPGTTPPGTPPRTNPPNQQPRLLQRPTPPNS